MKKKLRLTEKIETASLESMFKSTMRCGYNGQYQQFGIFKFIDEDTEFTRYHDILDTFVMNVRKWLRDDAINVPVGDIRRFLPVYKEDLVPWKAWI